ncbi:MAG: hypothetical protein ACJARD_001645 [Alphaproteobacteria bacterium]|jgi:hypothetical protein
MAQENHHKIPEKWQKPEKENSLKAIQLAFELEQEIATKIKLEAAHNNLNPSDQIRKILGLSYSPPKRPRLTVSLKPEDYHILGEKFNISPDNQLEIRRQIIAFLASQI